MCVACGSAGIGGPLPGRFAYSHFSSDLDLAPVRKLDEVIAMSPDEMARASRLVSGAYNELLQTAASLEDPGYRRLMTECIVSPKITFLEQFPTDQDRRRLFDEMVRLDFSILPMTPITSGRAGIWIRRRT